jgi:FtsZ-binding cell division protein ZapB
MSKSWSEVIENIDLSTKQLREPRKLSCDEIADLKEKCNPKYDLTILDLICTIEALQQENEQLRAKLSEWKYEVKCHMDEVIAREKQMARMRELLTKAYDERGLQCLN